MGTRNDPFKNCRFLLEIYGITIAGFSEVVMPESISNVIEYREGNEPPTVRKLPGLTVFSNLILKRGVTDSTELYEWRKLVEYGRIEEARRNISVILLDELGNEAARWNFIEAWPCAYSAPYLDALGNDVAIETLEITFEGMTRVK